MDPTFSIALGNGMFIDSEGNISSTPVPNKPLYRPKSGLPVSPDAIKKVADGVTKILPGKDDSGKPNKTWQFLSDQGASGELIAALAVIGTIASLVSTVMPILGFVLGVAKMFGLLDGGDSTDALKAHIDQRFLELEARAKADELRTQLVTASGRISTFHVYLQSVNEYILQAQNPYVNKDDLSNRLQAIRNDRLRIYQALDGLLRDPWVFTLSDTDYAYAFYLINNLFNIADGRVPTKVTLPNIPTLVFDHRPALPVAAYGIQSYLTALKAISPEYRTTGEFDQELRDLSGLIEDKLTEVRAYCLARTIYKEGDRFDCDPLSLVQRLVPPFGFPGLPVGAYDLREYTDDYLASVAKGNSTDQRATLQLHWVPPPLTKPGTYYEPTSQWILSAEEAAAANKQSEQDYANLLVSSGYMNLLHLAMAMRHLSTEPDLSETVQGDSFSLRHPQRATTVTVESDVPLSAPIVASGSREPQDWEVDFTITTQPLNAQNPIPYRVYLRTFAVDPHFPKDLEYDRYYSAQYIPDDTNTAFQNLRVTTYDSWVLDELKLIETATPVEPKGISGTASLKASTYDYLVPVTGPDFHNAKDSKEKVAALRGAGWAVGLVGGGSQAAPASGSGSPSGSAGAPKFAVGASKAGALSGVVFLPGAQDAGALPPGGEKRDVDVQPKTVEIRYALDWYADLLTIKLRSRPEDRNYLVYLVVEEQLGIASLIDRQEHRGTQWLHTAFPVQVVGQLTYVPQSFFDQEAQARKHLSQVLSDFARRYVRSAPPHIGDPETGVFSPGDLNTNAGVSRMLRTAQQLAPQLLEEAIAAASGQQARRAHT